VIVVIKIESKKPISSIIIYPREPRRYTVISMIIDIMILLGKWGRFLNFIFKF
jgi:hypothetical protein